MKKNLIAGFAVLVLVTLACGLPSVGGGAQPTAGAGGGVQSSNILFHDDFSSTSSGWDHVSDTDGSTDYYNGGYRILVNTQNYSLWANPSQVFQNDVRIEVDATKSAGPDDNAFGVICRYQDTDNFYRFYISSDGYAGIVKRSNGDTSVISSADGNLHQVSNINQGAATNHIRGDCIGSALTLYVNGTQVASATDSDFSGGDVGLVARSYDTGGTDILFDNFYVYKP